mmetsp:Transcript_2744/g.6067  ORF Transcript_2744/g.6067 Transcript_2744/m.6067 type:complete len:315 (+) Transcript_2744:282-1226(+)
MRRPVRNALPERSNRIRENLSPHRIAVGGRPCRKGRRSPFARGDRQEGKGDDTPRIDRSVCVREFPAATAPPQRTDGAPRRPLPHPSDSSPPRPAGRRRKSQAREAAQGEAQGGGCFLSLRPSGERPASPPGSPLHIIAPGAPPAIPVAHGRRRCPAPSVTPPRGLPANAVPVVPPESFPSASPSRALVRVVRGPRRPSSRPDSGTCVSGDRHRPPSRATFRRADRTAIPSSPDRGAGHPPGRSGVQRVSPVLRSFSSSSLVLGAPSVDPAPPLGDARRPFVRAPSTSPRRGCSAGGGGALDGRPVLPRRARRQ